MRSKRQQTIAKREREQAVREKRQRKIQKKLDRAAGILDEPATEDAPLARRRGPGVEGEAPAEGDAPVDGGAPRRRSSRR